MEVTIAICTHNRAAFLPRAIASVVGQGEVLVVDNASTDDTSTICASTPGIRYAAEPRVGLSQARNRALHEASHDIVLFLDDDAVAAPGWAAAHAAAFASDDTVLATGGPIHLLWPDGRRPVWMPRALDGIFAGLDRGDTPHVMAGGAGPFGANFGVRRQAAADLGGFDVRLGRAGSSLIGNEEAELVARIRASGGTVAYVPDAPVDHTVIPERVNLRWILRRAYAGGRSDALQGHAPATSANLTSLVKNAARAATLRGGGQWGRAGATAGLIWAAQDLGRLRG